MTEANQQTPGRIGRSAADYHLPDDEEEVYEEEFEGEVAAGATVIVDSDAEAGEEEYEDIGDDYID